MAIGRLSSTGAKDAAFVEKARQRLRRRFVALLIPARDREMAMNLL